MRQGKRDRTTEEVEFERNKEECTFRPNLKRKSTTPKREVETKIKDESVKESIARMRRAREEREQRERVGFRAGDGLKTRAGETSFFSRNTSGAAARTMDCEKKALNVTELLKRPPAELIAKEGYKQFEATNDKNRKREEALREVARELRWPSFSGKDSEKQYMLLPSEPGIEVRNRVVPFCSRILSRIRSFRCRPHLLSMDSSRSTRCSSWTLTWVRRSQCE